MTGPRYRRSRASAEIAEALDDAGVAERKLHRAVKDLYEAGATIREVATALGMTHEGARKVIHRSGAALRPAHARAGRRSREATR